MCKLADLGSRCGEKPLMGLVVFGIHSFSGDNMLLMPNPFLKQGSSSTAQITEVFLPLATGWRLR